VARSHYDPSVPESGNHGALMSAALERDAEGQRALLDGEEGVARRAFEAAAELYRRSWEAASPTSYGRLVGMLKAAVLAGAGAREAKYARAALAEAREDSQTAAYALAIAALIDGDDPGARSAAARMGSEPDAFGRAATAIAALADRDPQAYATALRAIVGDFERREHHLTGVPIADTAVMLERLARRRGLSAGLDSALLPRETTR
jgi:hypothetical protein